VNVTLAAPAKVNLTLDVGARRPDGYHAVDSVVAVLTRPADEVRVTPRPGTRGIRLICKDATLPKDERNHAVRAAQLFLDRFLPDEPVTIYIRLAKRLPKEAGLGGGSSDAAAVLRALAELYPGRAEPSALRELSAQIGSDIPLFLSGIGLVRVRGRGEIVEPLPAALPPLYGVLVKPDVGVPTPDAYRHLDGMAGRQPGRATPRLLAALRDGLDGAALAACLSNDFEGAILPHFPAVAAAHRAVTEAGAVRTLLCGSGSAVFGLARDRENARDLVKALVGRGYWVHLAQTHE
jgi:4-diphosphocytidyl-2-C-methyl-D-erythritol kinase